MLAQPWVGWITATLTVQQMARLMLVMQKACLMPAQLWVGWMLATLTAQQLACLTLANRWACLTLA